MDSDSAPRALILLVDDQPSNLDTLVAMLEDHHDLAVATSGGEALALLARTRRPDLILLDVMMPDLDGYATCEALKAAPATRDIPVIFVTARDDPASESRALNCGGVDFIHKPVNPDVLRARVRIQLELARHRFRLESLVHARTVALAGARDEAESTNRALRALLSNLSHELRTPLNQIMGFNYLLEQGSTDPETRTMLAQVRQSSEQLLRLLSNLIDLARVEAGSIQLAPLAFELPELLDRVVGEVAARHPDRAHPVRPAIDPALPRQIDGDPVRIGQVLSALLDNAVKFSDGQPVTLTATLVAATPEAATVRFEIRDRGPGLPATHRSARFDAFRQGDDSSTRVHGGLGLGLGLAQRLVALMAGTLTLDSADGDGTTARVELCLPIHAQAVVAGPAPVAQVDWTAATKTLGRLRELLDEGDCDARTLWEATAPRIGATLGELAPALAEALEAFDFETALGVVERAIAALPQSAPPGGAVR